MLLDDLRSQKSKIQALAQRYGAKRIRVFGSVARMQETRESDVDFLVDFSKGYDMFSQRLPLSRELAALIGRKVDLIPEHELNRHIRDSIIAESIDL